MKTFTLALLTITIFAGSAMAFSLPSVDANQTKLSTCITQEAKQALIAGSLTSANIKQQAESIAAACALKLAQTKSPETVTLATTIISGLVK